jgi:hypothetical protein
MSEIRIEDLSADQIRELESKIALKKQEEKSKVKKERDRYKELVSQTVREQIVELQRVSNVLQLAKANVYGAFSAIIALKQELYGSKGGQQSHTFSDEDGNNITIGFRTIDGFDDTIDAGIGIIRDYISGLAIDQNSAQLVDMINSLLKKDAKGNLKPSRILDLQNLADEVQNEIFSRGVEIIRSSYKPVRSAIFIEAETVAAIGAKLPVPLSITSVDFPEGFTANFEVFK